MHRAGRRNRQVTAVFAPRGNTIYFSAALRRTLKFEFEILSDSSIGWKRVIRDGGLKIDVISSA
jgi:hypothetical protein